MDIESEVSNESDMSKLTELTSPRAEALLLKLKAHAAAFQNVADEVRERISTLSATDQAIYLTFLNSLKERLDKLRQLNNTT